MGTFTKLISHIVFSTKFRAPLITAEIQPRLYDYIGGVIRGSGGTLIEIGGIEDHVHVLALLPANRSVSEIVRDLKANSSRWANELELVRGRFEWQKGYSAFSVSESQVKAVKRYIQNQATHHR